MGEIQAVDLTHLQQFRRQHSKMRWRYDAAFVTHVTADGFRLPDRHMQPRRKLEGKEGNRIVVASNYGDPRQRMNVGDGAREGWREKRAAERCRVPAQSRPAIALRLRQLGGPDDACRFRRACGRSRHAARMARGPRRRRAEIERPVCAGGRDRAGDLGYRLTLDAVHDHQYNLRVVG